MAKHKRQKIEHRHKQQKEKATAKTKADLNTASSKKTNAAPTIPFDADHRILLVGEGDFSFARSIVEEHGCYDITATCYDSKDELFSKYTPQAEHNTSYLEEEGQKVLYGVDATSLLKQKALRKGEKFDRILFNFPHVGGKSTDVNRQVRFNQELIFKFFQSASQVLAYAGSIVVTLFEGEPYTLWNIRDLARSNELVVERSFGFQANAYPGYSHARTLGNIHGDGGWKGEKRPARSYVFKAKDATTAENRPTKKRKHVRNADSDSE